MGKTRKTPSASEDAQIGHAGCGRSPDPQSDEEEKALVGLADGVSQAAAAEVQTTAPEEAAAIGTAAGDTAGAVGDYAGAQDTFIKAAAKALTDDDTATVKADVAYDNSVAQDAQTYVDNVAPAAATLYLAGYTADAWAAYNQVVQTQTAQQQSTDNTANVTRVEQIGTAEVSEAGGLGTAQSTLASAAGETETGLVGQLANNDDSTSSEEEFNDESFNGALGRELEQYLTSMAQADRNWITSAGPAIEGFQQSLGNDEVTAAGGISDAEAGYAESEAQNQETDAQNLDAQSASGQNNFNAVEGQAYENWLAQVAPTFENDSKTVAQDDADYQDALITDAVFEASGEVKAEQDYAALEGPAVANLVGGMAGIQDSYEGELIDNVGTDAENTAAADATQYTSLAKVQAAYTKATAQADADHQNWLAQNVGQPGYPPAGAAVPVDPQPQELADAQLTLSKGQADANLAWVKSKDAADEGFGMTDATEWASMAEGEAAAESAYGTADTAAAADYETGIAAAEAEQNTADDEAAITQTDDDATAEGDWQGNAAFGVAGAIQQMIITEEQTTGVGGGAWTLYEEDQLATTAKDTAYAATQQAAYVNQGGQNETNYLNTDLADYLNQLSTILGDDFSGGTSAAAVTAANDLAQAKTTVGDEVTFEQTVAPDVQAYQDTLAKDAHDAQWSEAQATHDLATGTIDAGTYATQMGAAATAQTTGDAAAAALYQSQVGGATVTQVETDADAALSDGTLDAGAVKSASDADALAVQKYTKQESAAYQGDTEDDASALESEQVNVAQQENDFAGQWNVNAVVYIDGNQVDGVSAPWGALMLQLAQANLNLVAGGTNADGSTYIGTAQAQQNLTDAQAEAQFTDEQSDADAQYTRDLAADVDQYNLSIGDAQSAHDAQYAAAATDAALVAAGAFPADLPGTSTAPDDGAPITASANYGLLETIGGYTMGPTTATSTSLVGAMFSMGPNMGAPYAGWTGWPGWSGADAPPNPGPPTNSSNNNPSGGVWSNGGDPPPEAPQILGFVEGGSENGYPPTNGNGQPGGGEDAPPGAGASAPAPPAPSAVNLQQELARATPSEQQLLQASTGQYGWMSNRGQAAIKSLQGRPFTPTGWNIIDQPLTFFGNAGLILASKAVEFHEMDLYYRDNIIEVLTTPSEREQLIPAWKATTTDPIAEKLMERASDAGNSAPGYWQLTVLAIEEVPIPINPLADSIAGFNRLEDREMDGFEQAQGLLVNGSQIIGVTAGGLNVAGQGLKLAGAIPAGQQPFTIIVVEARQVGLGSAKGMAGVSSRGTRNAVPLTEAQRAQVLDAANALGIDPSDITFFSGTQGSVYSDMMDKIIVGADIFPETAAAAGRSVFGRLSMPAALAHENAHMLAARAGISFAGGSVMEEFQASVLAGRNTAGLTSVERFQLLRNAIEEANANGVNWRNLRIRLRPLPVGE